MGPILISEAAHSKPNLNTPQPQGGTQIIFDGVYRPRFETPIYFSHSKNG